MAADDVVSLRGEANLDDIVRELERIQTELDLVQKKGHEEILIDAEVQAALEEVERLKRAVDQVGTEDEKVKIDAEIGPALAKLKELSTTYRQRLDEMRRQQTPFEALGRDAREETTRAIRRLRDLERQFRESTNRMRRAADDVDFDPASDSARRLQRDVAQSARAMIRHLDGLDPEIRQKVTGFDDVRRAARRASQEVRKFETSGLDNAKGSVDRLTGAFRGLQIAANAFFASIIVDRIVRFGREVVNASAALQDMERSYAALFDSQEEGNRQMERAEELARLLGLSLDETRLSFRNFVVSAQEAGFEAETAAAIYESLAIAAKGIGGSQQEASNALRAFTQVISKGKIQAEELRGQLGDALPGSLSILANEMGMTTQALDKMLEQGELTTEQLIELSNGMLKVFGPAALANIEGTRAEMDRFRTALEGAAEIIGGELSEQVALFLQDLNLMGEDGEAQAQRIGEAMGNAAELVRRDLILITDILRGDWASAWDQARATVASFASSVASIMGRLIGTLAEIVATPFEGLAQAAALALDGVRRAAVEMLDFLAEKLPAGFGRAAKEAADELRGLEGAFEQTVENIDGAAQRFGDKWREAGSEVAGVLDDIGEKLEEQARTSRGTTDEQIGHQQELQDKLEELRKLFEKLISERKEGAKEVTEAERKELEKQRQLFADFADDVRALLDGVGEVDVTPRVNRPQGDTGAVGGDSGASQEVAQLQQQLESLRAEKAKLDAQPVLSQEDVQRAGELSGEIFRLEARLAGATAAAQGFGDALGNFGRPEGAGNFGADMAQEFDEAATQIESRGEQMTELLAGLVGSGSFQDAFSGLDASAQRRIKSLIGQFLEIQDSVGATEEDIRVFTDAILGEMERAGGAVGQLGEEFGGIDTSAVDRAWEALGELGDKAEEAGEGAKGLGDKMDGAVPKIEETADGIRIYTEEAEGAGESSEQAAEGIEQVGDAAEEAGEGLESVGEAAGEAGGEMEEAGESAKTLQDLIKEMGEGVEEAGTHIEGAGEDIKIFQDGVEQTGEAADEAGIRIEGTGEEIEILGQKAEESQEKVKGAGEAATEAAEPMEQLGEAAEKAKGPMEGVAEAADKIAQSEGAPENIRQTGEAAQAAAEPAERTAESMGLLADALEKIGQEKAAEEIRAMVGGLQELTGPLEMATEAAQPFSELVAKIAESIGIAADNLDRTVAGLTAFGEQLEAVSALLEEGRVQEGLSLLAEAMEEATPSIEAAAEQLARSAEALTTIAEQASASAEGVRAFAEASQEAVDSGALEALAKSLEALGEQVKPVAEDMQKISDAIVIIVESAPDVEEAAERIGIALDDLAAEERLEKVDELLKKIGELRDELAAAARKAGELVEAFEALGEAAKKTLEDLKVFAEGLRNDVSPAVSQITGMLSEMVAKLREIPGAAQDALRALMEMDQAIPVIERVTASVAALAAQLAAAAAAARDLNAALSEVSI